MKEDILIKNEDIDTWAIKWNEEEKTKEFTKVLKASLKGTGHKIENKTWDCDIETDKPRKQKGYEVWMSTTNAKVLEKLAKKFGLIVEWF